MSWSSAHSTVNRSSRRNSEQSALMASSKFLVGEFDVVYTGSFSSPYDIL